MDTYALVYTLLAALVVSSASLSGVLFSGTRGSRFLALYTHHLLACSVGVLLVTLYGIGNEMVEHTLSTGGTLVQMVVGAGGGALLLFLATRLHPHHHHEHDAEEAHSIRHKHAHSRLDGRTMLITNAVHIIGDGVVLYPAFIIGPIVGIATLVGMVIHEGIEKVATFFILKQAGYTTREALMYSFLTASCIFIGVFLSFVASRLDAVLPWLFAVSFGSLLYLIVVDVLPCVFVYQKKWSAYVPLVVCIICGALLMYGVSVAFPH